MTSNGYLGRFLTHIYSLNISFHKVHTAKLNNHIIMFFRGEGFISRDQEKETNFEVALAKFIKRYCNFNLEGFFMPKLLKF